MKKNKKEIKHKKIVLIGVVVILFVFLMLFLVFHIIPEILKPSFIIYENVCENETEIEYYNYGSFKDIECPEIITKVDCFDNNGNLIKGLTCEHKERLGNGDYCIKLNEEGFEDIIFSVEVDFIGYGNPPTFFFTKYLYGELQPNFYGVEDTRFPKIEKSRETKQTCTQKEVDYFEFCDEPPCFGIGECNKLCDSIHRDSFIENINKNDFDADFINYHLDNFKCIEGNYSGGYFTEENLCSKYQICDYEGKCGNYIVEVQR